MAEDEEAKAQDVENDKYIAALILPNIESTFGEPTEMYSMRGIELLQRKIEYYKQLIDYDSIKKKFDEGIKGLSCE